LRFAIKTAPQNTTWPAMLSVFRAADDIDVFESGWTFDHFYPIFSDPTGPCFEGWTVTTALAQATRRLRVGVMVTGNPYRHPAVLANMAASLDVISDGRLELGLGAGWNQEECDAYGIELPQLKERFDRLEEAFAVIVGLLANETTDFAGAYYRLEAARCEPKPVQRPHPPICVGGGGEKRTLRIAARWAQHWNLAAGPPEVFAHKRGVLHSHCEAIGRDPREIVTSVQVHFGRDQDPKELADHAARFADAGCDLVVIPLAPPHDANVLEPLADALGPLAA
jgi:F420-dependent oxidoreductase-like protein